MNKTIYMMIRAIVLVLYKLVFWIRLEGKENLPEGDGMLFCSNHLSNLDPPTVAVMVPRKLRFLAKEELFHNKPFAWLIRHLGATPITRGGADVSAVKTCIRILRGGENLLMFPQGTRRKVLREKDVKPGAIVIAQRSGVPIVPLAICGKYRPFSRMKVKIGKCITQEEVSQIMNDEAVTDKTGALQHVLYERMAALMEGDSNLAK